MAVKVERRVVCDFGERHGGEIGQYRITADGVSATFDLCATCAKPITKLLAKADKRTPAPARMKIYTLSEIEASKREKTPTSE